MTNIEPTYDCTADVKAHQRLVRALMAHLGNQIFQRAWEHDASKLQPPEKEVFDAWTPKLRELTFGTDHYKAALDAMGEGLKHHYAVNRHHPEHFPNGLNGMTLVDVLEMLCDWMAVAQKQGVTVDLAHAMKRFGLSPQLVEILWNTLREVDEDARWEFPIQGFAVERAELEQMVRSDA